MGVEKAAPEFDDNKGVSLVLVNTQKGQEWFDKTKGSIIWKETQIEDSMQRAFIKPEKRPVNREKFWNEYNNKGIDYIAKKYSGNTPILRKIARGVKKVFLNVLKALRLSED